MLKSNRQTLLTAAGFFFVIAAIVIAVPQMETSVDSGSSMEQPQKDAPVVHTEDDLHRKLMIQARTGDQDAQYDVGLLLLERNLKTRAKFWLLRAAWQGHKSAPELLKTLPSKDLAGLFGALADWYRPLSEIPELQVEGPDKHERIATASSRDYWLLFRDRKDFGIMRSAVEGMGFGPTVFLVTCRSGSGDGGVKLNIIPPHRFFTEGKNSQYSVDDMQEQTDFRLFEFGTFSPSSVVASKFGNNAVEFLDKLSESHRLIVEIETNSNMHYPFLKATVKSEFDITNFEFAILPLRDTCGLTPSTMRRSM